MHQAPDKENIFRPDSRRSLCAGVPDARLICLHNAGAESGFPMRMRMHAEQTNAAAARPQDF